MKIILLTILTLAIAFAVIYTYYGGFNSLSFSVETQGGETIVYEEMKGDYSQTPKSLDRIYETLIKDGIETYRGIGVFYDNPKIVEKENLRSDVGCIVENQDTSKLNKLTSKYNIRQINKGEYIVTEFPNKGMMSILVGVFKVYPALAEYAATKGYKTGAITEIYDVTNKKTIYRAEIIE